MFAFLPIVAFFLGYYCLCKKGHLFSLQWRGVFLITCVLWGILAYGLIEVLSFFNLLTFSWVVLSWILVVFILTFMARAYSNSEDSKPDINIDSLSRTEKILVFIMIGCIPISIFITAIISPPNNYDAMGYHMSRVMHWIQNHNTKNYPTHDLRQLIHPRWSEYAILHFQILSCSDRFANLVQWFSMVGSLIGVSLIAQSFGANRRGQIFSALFAATIPMGILQASSAQNDYVTTFWLVCFINCILMLSKSRQGFYLFMNGISLGLALLSKATAYIYVLPFLFWLYILLRREGHPKLLRKMFVIVGLALVLNSPVYLRNIDLCGHPLSEYQINDGRGTVNEDMSLLLWTSNFVRNMSLHLFIFSEGQVEAVSRLISQFHQFFDMDELDPRITYGEEKFEIGGYSFHEDYAGNPFHLLVIIVCFICFVFSKKFKQYSLLGTYVSALLLAIVLFNMVIRWNPWNSRYHLPVFVLFASFAGIVLAHFLPRKIGAFFVLVLAGFSLAWVFLNQTRPLAGCKNIFNTNRTDLYFSTTPGFRASYLDAVKLLRKNDCYTIGLMFRTTTWEYPLWDSWKQSGSQKIRIESINVQNSSNKYPIKDFRPCGIVTVNTKDQETIIFNHTEYQRFGRFHVLDVYLF